GSKAHPGEHSEAIRLEREVGGDSAKQEDLFGSRIADRGKLLERLAGLGQRKFENRAEIAVELGESDAGNFAPSRDAKLGAHAAHFRQRKKHFIRRVPDGVSGKTNLETQALEDLGSPLI